ncbi:substrate-binding domain-containing protein [Mesorhizobium sp. B2-6-2]|uniref:substrate-binding domain-containing protein n=1 Tax=Mesorhizobium sp. B2-6-2 TaxID=2589915 RepID=UPI0015E2E458|nr:substrate-binding domain-containing protein [Mesorhizobium sp. B2-6-2]
MEKRTFLKGGAIAIALGAVGMPKISLAAGGRTIGISIPAATHGWTGGLNFQTKRTVEQMKKAFPDIEFVVAAANDASKQVNDVEDLVARGIDALVILPFESEPLTEPVKQAKAQGVFITTVDRGLAEEGIEDLYVGGNNPQYGVIAGQYFKKKFPDGAKIVVMRGIPTTIDNVRIDAFKKELEGSKVQILDMQFANWNPDKGFEVMQDFLQKFDAIDGVWAGDDDAALGAMEAIKQANRPKPIVVLGGSGMNKVVKMVKDGGGAVDADIFYPPTLIIPAIELTTMRAATQAPIRGRYILDSPLITKDNAEEFYFPDSPY